MCGSGRLALLLGLGGVARVNEDGTAFTVAVRIGVGSPADRKWGGGAAVDATVVTLLPPDAEADDDGKGNDQDNDHSDPAGMVVPPV